MTTMNQILSWICRISKNTTEPYPLFLKGDYHEEINHPWPAEIIEQHDEEQSFPMGPVYDDYESDPWESQEDEPEEQQEGEVYLLSRACK
jgi:hypothetical protein